MGRVRTETVKKVARELIEKHPGKFTSDFEANKTTVNDLVDSRSKRLRNRIAGYVTRLVVVQAKREASLAPTTVTGSESAADEEE